MRPVLDEANIHPAIRDKIASNRGGIVAEVQAAIEAHDVVVVGMTINPHVKKARKVLAAEGITHEYLGYGGYTSRWRERNALKMWTGWPTFPMVFVKGTLVGGGSDVATLAKNGELKKLLA